MNKVSSCILKYLWPTIKASCNYIDYCSTRRWLKLNVFCYPVNPSMVNSIEVIKRYMNKIKSSVVNTLLTSAIQEVSPSILSCSDGLSVLGALTSWISKIKFWIKWNSPSWDTRWLVCLHQDTSLSTVKSSSLHKPSYFHKPPYLHKPSCDEHWIHLVGRPPKLMASHANPAY